MKHNKKIHPIVLAMICGVVSALLDFVLVPLTCGGLPDIVFIILMILFPTAAALLLYCTKAHYSHSAGYVLFGVLVQYIFLILAARLISPLLGIDLDTSLGLFTYIGAAFPWPVLIGFIQFSAVIIFRKVKKTK